jgi:hypothetical protein
MEYQKKGSNKPSFGSMRCIVDDMDLVHRHLSWLPKLRDLLIFRLHHSEITMKYHRQLSGLRAPTYMSPPWPFNRAGALPTCLVSRHAQCEEVAKKSSARLRLKVHFRIRTTRVTLTLHYVSLLTPCLGGVVPVTCPGYQRPLHYFIA